MKLKEGPPPTTAIFLGHPASSPTSLLLLFISPSHPPFDFFLTSLFLLLLLSAFLGWIRLSVRVEDTLRAQHSVPATSIPLDPDHPFRLSFLTWRTSCLTILVNSCSWAFDDHRKGFVFFFFSLPQLDCFGTPADCHTPGANGEIIIKDTRHCIVVFMLGKHRSRYEISPRLISTLWDCFDDPSHFATPQ